MEGVSPLSNHTERHLKDDRTLQGRGDLLPRRRSNSHPEDVKKIVYEYMVACPAAEDPTICTNKDALSQLWKNEECDTEIQLLQQAIPHCTAETPTSNTNTVTNLTPYITSAFTELYIPVVSLKRSAQPERAAIVSLKRSQNAAELIAFLTCRERTIENPSVHE
jgi:hypothetical protein